MCCQNLISKYMVGLTNIHSIYGFRVNVNPVSEADAYPHSPYTKNASNIRHRLGIIEANFILHSARSNIQLSFQAK